jgi:hypothetical protein
MIGSVPGFVPKGIRNSRCGFVCVYVDQSTYYRLRCMEMGRADRICTRVKYFDIYLDGRYNDETMAEIFPNMNFRE